MPNGRASWSSDDFSENSEYGKELFEMLNIKNKDEHLVLSVLYYVPNEGGNKTFELGWVGFMKRFGNPRFYHKPNLDVFKKAEDFISNVFSSPST